MDKEKKSSDLKSALADLQKRLGLRVSRIEDRDDDLNIEAISSGSLSVNDALGVDGFPRGRVIEIYGKQGSGKTLLSLLTIAEAQKNGGTAAFIDVEHAFDPTWAKKLGVNVEDLYFTQPDYGEQALTAVEELVKTNEFDVIVIDSTAALIPKDELEGELQDHTIALQARMMSKALRRMTAEIGKSKTVVIFINQVRTNPMAMFGNPEVTPGGEALKFYSSVRISVSRKSKSEVIEVDRVVGHTVKIKVVKNKVAPPLREAEFVINYNTGVDRLEELATLALERNIVQARGPMYYFEEASWKGREAFVTELRSEKPLQDAILAKLKVA
jgi:recombination protein RecA